MSDAIKLLFVTGLDLLAKAREFALAQGMKPDELDAYEMKIERERASKIDAAREAELKELSK